MDLNKTLKPLHGKNEIRVQIKIGKDMCFEWILTEIRRVCCSDFVVARDAYELFLRL